MALDSSAHGLRKNLISKVFAPNSLFPMDVAILCSHRKRKGFRITMSATGNKIRSTPNINTFKMKIAREEIRKIGKVRGVKSIAAG